MFWSTEVQDNILLHTVYPPSYNLSSVDIGSAYLSQSVKQVKQYDEMH